MSEPADDFSSLHPSMHMLQWLDEDPPRRIRTAFEEWGDDKVAGTRVVQIAVVGKPQFLTGGKRLDDDPEKMRLVRTGVAFAFAVHIRAPDGEDHHVKGVFSWIGMDLDEPTARQRLWIDVDGSLDELGSEGRLRTRVYGED